MSRKHDLRRADYWRRLLAAGCAALVFALGLFAASPTLHEQLHHNGHVPADDGCVIAVFAGGVSMPVDMAAIAPPAAAWREQAFVVAKNLFRTSPRHVLPPTHGPPVA